MGDEVPAEGSGGAPAYGSALLKRMTTGVATLDVDGLIKQLLSVRGRGPNAQVNLPEEDIRALCVVARDVFLDQPALLQLATPIKICGDIHGQYHDLLRLFDFGGHPPSANYLFLGDYVDRGKRSLETISLLLCYKVKYPQNFFIMRGNHESASINKMYGFYDECKRRYSTKLWKNFTDCFNCLPMAAVVDQKIFCAHGGLSPELTDLEQINRIARPTDVPDTGLLCDLLWSDPDREIIGWGENDRGVSFTFGEDIVTDFLSKHDLDLVCRAHQVVEDGYEFFARRRLVTLFSAPNYCGEFDNAGAMMSVDESLMCSFQILQATENAERERYQRKSSGANRGWLTNGPVGAARLSSAEIPDSAVPEDDDPLLVPVLMSLPKTRSSGNSSDVTRVSSGGDPAGGVAAGSAPAVAGMVDVSNGSEDGSATASLSMRRRRTSRQRSIDSVTSNDDGDRPAAFVPLPSSSSTNSSSSSSRRSGNNDNARNRRKMVSPPPPVPLSEGLGGVAVGSGALAASESGGAPALGSGLALVPSEKEVRKGKTGPMTPSPPKTARPIVTSSRESRAEDKVAVISGEPTAEGGGALTMTSSREVEGERRYRKTFGDRVERGDVRSPERQLGDSGNGSRLGFPSATPLSSALATKRPEAVDVVSRGGVSRSSSSKSKKRGTQTSLSGGDTSGRRHRHSTRAEQETTPSSSSGGGGGYDSNSNSGSESRRRRRSKHAASETRRKSGDYDHGGNNNHNHISNQSNGGDVDVDGVDEALLANGSTMTRRIVSPSSAGNGKTSFGGTGSSSSSSKSRRFSPQKPSTVEIESVSSGSSSSAAVITNGFREVTGVASTSSTSGGVRKSSASIRSQQQQQQQRRQRQVQEDAADICVLSSDGGSSTATCGTFDADAETAEEEIRDGEGSRRGRDPVDRIARHIATAAAAAAAAAEAEADGRDIALRVGRQRQEQEQEQKQKKRQDEDMNGSTMREYGAVGGDDGVGIAADGGMERDRGTRDTAERATRGEREGGRRLREKRRAKTRAREERGTTKAEARVTQTLSHIIPQSSAAVAATGDTSEKYGFSTPPTKTGNPVIDSGSRKGVSASEAFVNGVDGREGIGAMVPSVKAAAEARSGENGGTFGKRDALVRVGVVSSSSSGGSFTHSGSVESSSINSGDARSLSEEKLEEDEEQQQQQGTLDNLDVGSVGVESPGTGTSTHSVDTRLSHQSSFVDSFVSSNDSDRKRTRRGMLGAVKKGLGSVWDKVTADHPEPLPVDKTLTKEEQKALHFRNEKEGRNDWSHNSVAEQHQMVEVLKVEEERVWR